MYWNQLEIATLKNLFSLAVLKLDVKDSSESQRNWKNEKKPINLLYIKIV